MTSKKFFRLLMPFITSIVLVGCVTSYPPGPSHGQPETPSRRELDSGWVFKKASELNSGGEEISVPTFSVTNWKKATVPGTVLTSLLNDSLIPDPFYGMNNEKIPDIYDTGAGYYTYWFVRDFHETPPVGDEHVWLNFRGVNYGFDVYLNGHKVSTQTQYGMFLRRSFDITHFLSRDSLNRISVIVYPPNPVGDPNGGQGGDGTIARSVTNQYVAGWDWIEPVHDRNTGIWDKVTIDRTGSAKLRNIHVVTRVPGKRMPGSVQSPAIVEVSAEIQNPSDEEFEGTLSYTLSGNEVRTDVRVPADTTIEIRIPDYTLVNPRLWWPNGYGEQNLYRMKFHLSDGNRPVDEKEIDIGIREIQTTWNEHTRSREVFVNGQRIFIKGGDWITSDAMLRLSAARYDAEIRFHRDMNLNLIRIWGGGITERPEFYDACDKYGILVFQDFWMSGDCNGKWIDRMKKDDQWTRRKYPDDHALFIKSIRDQIKMIRNHPSLAFYCGGNEITPPEDILNAIQDSLLPVIDSTRYFFTYSNMDSMSYNSAGETGDGPYWIEPVEYFWRNRFFPFNSEIGSVGVGDVESLKRFVPPADLTVLGPGFDGADSVWKYHKFAGYGKFLDAYGPSANLEDYTERAQLANYDEYRALMEGHISHMWDWYTGVIIWKTQNPWTALRGQMYDYYLDPNAGLYGLHHADETLHVMYDRSAGVVEVANHSFRSYHDLMLQVNAINVQTGSDSLISQVLIEVSPSSIQKFPIIKRYIDPLFASRGGFLSLRLVDMTRRIISDNFYWLPDSTGSYSGLQRMTKAGLVVRARNIGTGRVEVHLENPKGNPVAFFNRISLIDRLTNERILPTFYSDNYVSVIPGEERDVELDCPAGLDYSTLAVSVKGWNVGEQIISLK